MKPTTTCFNGVSIALLLLPWAGCAQRSGGQIQPARTVARQTPTSLLGRPLHALPPDADREKLQSQLAAAEADLSAHPGDPAKIVWVARRLGYLWRIEEAIEVYSKGLKDHPDYAPLLRHRGHRYITLRRFDKAVADLERAAELIEGKPEEVEQDGMPNARNIALTTTAFNVWYHLGLARYLRGEFGLAVPCFQTAMKLGRGYDDNLVATTHWLYMSLVRLGRDSEAAALLEPISPGMEIIENDSYHRCLLVHKGLLEPSTALDVPATSGVDLATVGYGVGFRYLYTGRPATAQETFERVVAGPTWPAFGFIASEVEIFRSRQAKHK